MCQMCQMPNIWHIWHTKHQKPHFIRCSKFHNFCHIWIVSLHICHCTDENGITNYNIFLFFFLSPLSSAYSFLFSLTFVLSHRFPFSYKLLIRHRRSSSPIHHCRSLTGCILHRHCWSLRASSSSSPIRIDVGIDIEVRSKSMLRWDRSVRHDCGHRHWDLDCGHWRWGEVRSWLWVADASGFVALDWRC